MGPSSSVCADGYERGSPSVGGAPNSFPSTRADSCPGFGGGARLNGFLGISGNYTQLGADATKDLRNTEPTALGELSAAVSYSLTAGFSMSP